MDRLLAGAGGTLSLLTYDTSGALADVDGANAPTVTIRDSALPAGTLISTIGGGRSSAGTYTCVVPVTYATLDTFTATWTWPSAAFRQTQFEVVGSFLFSDAQLRAFDPELIAATYPAARVRDVREIVEDRFARACGVSFTRRGRREYLSGDGTSSLILDERMMQSLVSVKDAGSAIAATSFTLQPHGIIEYTGGLGSFGWGTRNIEVLYEHGFATPPSDVVDAGMRYARYILVPGANKNDERVTTIQYDTGFARLSVPGRDGFTGLPDVDAVLNRYNFRGALA